MSETVLVDLVHGCGPGESVPVDLVHGCGPDESVPVDLVHGCGPDESVLVDLVHGCGPDESVPVDLVHGCGPDESVLVDLVHGCGPDESVPVDLVHGCGPDGESVPVDLVHGCGPDESVLVDLVHGCGPDESVLVDLVHGCGPGESVPVDLVHGCGPDESVPVDLVHGCGPDESVLVDLVHGCGPDESVPVDLVHGCGPDESVLVDLVHGCGPDESVPVDLVHGCGPDGESVPVDLVHGCGPESTGPSLQDSRVFLLCGTSSRNTNIGSHALLSSCRSVHVLDSGSIAECLYRFKQTVDRLGLSSVRVLTTPRGRDVLVVYQEQLFTALYTFDYQVHPLTCPGCTGPAHTDPPAARVHEEEVSRFLQQLPALKGDIRVLKSTLIPDCFGHGFSTRAGGVSSIQTLSSLNLFSSSRRRDPGAVVLENTRRLALHAGFHPQNLRLVKVSHGSGVCVVGKAEPERYDAVVTDQAGVVVAAPGADCMPILFADPVSKVIGAAHAGWRGTLMGVAMATVDTMVKEFGCRVGDIVVAVGPSVGACCFTLDRERALDFLCIHPDCVPDPESARPHVNIRLASRILLQRGGVLPEHIHDDTVTDRSCVTLCTSCHPELFFSHVRDGPNFGTQVGFLWIRETRPPEGQTD